MRPLATIGYEKTSPEEFVAALKAGGVDELVDVRWEPFSYKPGFSKAPLQELMRSAAIDYSHVKVLGNPKSGREAAKAGDVEEFHAIYRGQMATPGGMEAIEEIASRARAKCLCLMCFERSHEDCHRGLLAEKLAQRGFVINHLTPVQTVKDAKTAKKTPEKPDGGQMGLL